MTRDDVIDEVRQWALTTVDRTPRRLLDLVYYGFYSITPEVPRTIWLNFSTRRLLVNLAWVFVMTLFFTLAFTSLVTLSIGRFVPDADPRTIQFGEDKWNLILYAVVCPLYVSFCVAIIGFAAEYWARNREAEAEGAGPRGSLRQVRLVISLFAMLSVCSIFISQYLYDLLYGSGLTRSYWFAEQINGVHVLNRAGFYYLILNFALLLISLAGATSYCSLAIQAMKDARALRVEDCGDIAALLARFDAFQNAALFMRLLALCYIANTILWNFSPLSAATATNIAASVIVILCIGVAGTRLPQFYVEWKLEKLRDACRECGIEEDELHLLPIGNKWLRALTNISGGLVSFGFVWIIYPDFNPQHLTDWLASLLK